MDFEELIEQWMNELFRQADLKPICGAAPSVTEMLPMSDGVKLETIIRLPDAAADESTAYPVIVKRSCYPGQKNMLEIQAKEFAKRGFGFVYQWCRGTGGSEGSWEPNVNERQDGLTTLQWLSEQPFVQNIGYWGDSYLALTGWCMADAVPKKVKTMFLGVYGVDRHTSAYQDGLFRQDVLTSWAMENAGVHVKADLMDSYRFRPQVEVDEKLWGVRLEWYRDWITQPDRSSSYWKQGFWGMLKEIPGKCKIPLFIKEGWYDHHLGSALASYDRLSKEAKSHSVLQIGPWNHGYQPVIPHESVKNLRMDDMNAPLNWFHSILVEEKVPEGHIEKYVIGADEWKTEKQHGKPSAYKRFFLSAAGADTEAGCLPEPPVGNGQVSYLYDPQNPVESHGTESMLTHMQEQGSLKQPDPGWRSDVISFVSEPLEEAFVTDGAINVKLYVSSDAEDTAFAAKLMEVFPDGEAYNIRSSITTLAYRNGADMRLDYQPEEIVEINIRMWDIAWKLRKGSRIRLDVTSSDFPQYSVHTNFPGVWSIQEQTKSVRQTIYAGQDYPSCIELPIPGRT